MNSTIGIVLPVRNAETTLQRQVHDLLEILPDLGAPFELLIVDDGSTDQTPEIAHELSVKYPQIRVLRWQRERGTEIAIRAAMDRLQAAVVLVQLPGQPLRTADLGQLVRREQDPVTASLAIPSALLDRLAAWGQAVTARVTNSDEPADTVHEHSEAAAAGGEQQQASAVPHGWPVLRRAGRKGAGGGAVRATHVSAPQAAND